MGGAVKGLETQETLLSVCHAVSKDQIQTQLMELSCELSLPTHHCHPISPPLPSVMGLGLVSATKSLSTNHLSEVNTSWLLARSR